MGRIGFDPTSRCDGKSLQEEGKKEVDDSADSNGVVFAFSISLVEKKSGF